MKKIITSAKWALTSIPITYLVTFIGEGFFIAPFLIVILFIFCFPGMLVADYITFNFRHAHEYWRLSAIYIMQYLYFFIVILIARLLRNKEKVQS